MEYRKSGKVNVRHYLRRTKRKIVPVVHHRRGFPPSKQFEFVPSKKGEYIELKDYGTNVIPSRIQHFELVKKKKEIKPTPERKVVIPEKKQFEKYWEEPEWDANKDQKNEKERKEELQKALLELKEEREKEEEKLRNLSYTQLRKRGIIEPRGDLDGDGVINKKDCKPLDKKRQDKVADEIARERFEERQKERQEEEEKRKRIEQQEDDEENGT